jgi:undecaprenyl-diphosphatase
MSILQALTMAILQGVTELFPVSSLGHAVVIPALLNWDMNLHDVAFLPFLTLLHLGTGTALVIYFWRDWQVLLVNGLKPASARKNEGAYRLFWLIVVATAPAVIIGAGFEGFFRSLFGSPLFVAGFLMINGGLLIMTERMRGREGTLVLDRMGMGRALLIGFSQALALFPGISRSGITIMAGLGSGLRHDDAARFSFLLATPIIFAAAAYEIYKMYKAGLGISLLYAVSAVVAGVAAYASVAFLMRYFGKHEFKALNPFGYYCLGFGGFAFAVLVMRG